MNIPLVTKDKIESVLSTFETGSPDRDYAKVTNARGDKGGLTYGFHQTTLTSGNLYKLLAEYSTTPKAAYGEDFKPYLPRLKAGDTSLNGDKTLQGLLKKAGKDPIMHSVQDEFFDRIYWRPAYQFALKNGFVTPLAMLVLYDSFIHSGQIRWDLRNRFKEKPPALGGDEKKWIAAYVAARHDWLKHHSMPILRKTIYRTQTFKDLIADNNWELDKPMKVKEFNL